MRKLIDGINNAVIKLFTYAGNKKDRSKGAIAIEYVLIAALVSIALVTGVTALGTALIAEFGALTTLVATFTP